MALSKRTTLISLGVIALITSLLAVPASNYFFSIVLNHAALSSTFITAFPVLMLCASLMVCFLFIYRLYKRPKTFKRMAKLYLIINIVLSSIGLITSLLTGVVTYGSFLKPYPFPGYAIIFLIVHLIFLAGYIFGLVFLKKVNDDEEVFKSDWKHVLKTIGWFLFIGLVFNRCGFFLLSPTYIVWRTFDVTFIFYLFMLMIVLVGVYKVLVDFEVINCRKAKIITSSVMIGVIAALFVVIAIIGSKYTVFISAVSPAMPLERLASMPLELPIHLAASLAVLIILLVQAIKKKEVKE